LKTNLSTQSRNRFTSAQHSSLHLARSSLEQNRARFREEFLFRTCHVPNCREELICVLQRRIVVTARRFPQLSWKRRAWRDPSIVKRDHRVLLSGSTTSFPSLSFELDRYLSNVYLYEGSIASIKAECPKTRWDRSCASRKFNGMLAGERTRSFDNMKIARIFTRAWWNTKLLPVVSRTCRARSWDVDSREIRGVTRKFRLPTWYAIRGMWKGCEGTRVKPDKFLGSAARYENSRNSKRGECISCLFAVLTWCATIGSRVDKIIYSATIFNE